MNRSGTFDVRRRARRKVPDDERSAKTSDTTMNTTLDLAEIGHLYRIQGIDCDEKRRRRYFDLGMIPGTTLEKILVSASGDPSAYRVRGAVFSMRASDAKHIFITTLK